MKQADREIRPERPARLGPALCLGLPFLLRLLLSWAFYGSTDTQNYLSAMDALVKGWDNLFNYYTPSFFPEALGVLGGLLTPLPMSAAFKMGHAIPDLILSAWFYTKLVQANGGRPKRSIYLLTVLLQLAPTVVMVSHLHGQMDSWSILFTVIAVEFFLCERPAWAFAGGLAMIFGAGIKIFPLFLIPCFYLHRPWRLRHLAWFSFGLAAGFVVYFSQRFSDPHLVWIITTGALGYQSQALMGIKGIIWPYLQKLPGGAPSLRSFVLGGLALAYLFAFVRRLDLYRSLLLALLAVMTVSFHMAPQYLMWPTFLLFFVGMYRTAVLYNVGAGSLLIFYYYITRDNSGTYVPLVALDRWAPARPHWFDERAMLYLFNDRLRGPGIWWIIALSLLSLVGTILWQQRRSGRPSPDDGADRRLFARPGILRTGMAVVAVGYGLTLLFTWQSPFRRLLSRQVDAAYVEKNFFSYGSDYLYEVTMPVAAAREAPQFTFSGNDFYVILQNGSPLAGPFVGRAFPPHHRGVFSYKPEPHPIHLPPAGEGTAGEVVKFWILDGNGSIDASGLPRFAPLTAAGTPAAPAGLRVAGGQISAGQLGRVFSEWNRHGALPADIMEQLELRPDLAPDTGPDDGGENSPLATPDILEEGSASVIDALWIALGGWAVLGLFSFPWKFRASNI
ncbi:MAG TPA: hypothetical protein VG838_03235 [Opitutaceae bacterium]|nr:hypothetical protein [Opitutaceae bacterium]HWB98893.1 hypothetical protein [Bryobacteraceae bacterium]